MAFYFQKTYSWPGLSGCRRRQRDKDAMLSPDGGGAGDALL